MKQLLAAAAFACATAASAQAATETIQIRGYVPVVCNADFRSSPSSQGDLLSLGVINEFCNAGSGYQVEVDYTVTSDPGALIIDGHTVPLDGSGHAILAVMNGPRMISQTLAYAPGSSPISTIHIALVSGAI